MKSQSKILPFLLFAFHLSFAQTENGTTIVVYLFPGNIMVGADTKVSLRDLQGNLVRETNKCKIYRGNDSVYFAFSGKTPADSVSGINFVHSTALRACKEGMDIRAIATLFELYSLDSLRIDPEEIDSNKQIKKGDAFIQVAFFGIENGVSTCSSFDYTTSNIFRHRDTSLIKRDDASITKYALRLELGFHESIDSLFSANPAFFSGDLSTLTDKMDTLIRLEMASSPHDVGGDVDILLIFPTGHIWLQNKNKCQNF